jgi:hypothetical protein
MTEDDRAAIMALVAAVDQLTQSVAMLVSVIAEEHDADERPGRTFDEL